MRRKIFLNSAAILIAALAAFLPSADINPLQSSQYSPDLHTEAAALHDYGRLPVLFIPNQGQMDKAVRYCARMPQQMLYFTEQGIVFDLIRHERVGTSAANARQAERLVFSLAFQGTEKRPSIDGLNKDSSVVNYLLGNDPQKWHMDVPTFREIVYRDVYPGIDLRFYDSGGMLRYDFIVNPGASPDNISLAYSGIDGLAIESGELVVSTALGRIIQTQPHIYQQIDGTETEVEGGFRLTGNNGFGFHVAAYNKDYPLIIDPVLIYSTYLGGAGNDSVRGITVDASGCAYIAGYTNSANFPTQFPFQAANAGNYDAFVSKLSADGNSLVYSTYLGGAGYEQANGIAVDTSGCIVVAGETNSSDFPVLNPFQAANAGIVDAFVAKLSATGNGLIYSTYLGGADYDYGTGVAVDASGCAYISGETGSSDFPVLNPFQAANAGNVDAFVTKLSATGNSLIYSTYLGGAEIDYELDIAVDTAGCAFVIGYTGSANFPTQNPFQAVIKGYNDVFVARLSKAGNSLLYSTYLGGSGSDYGRSIAVDSSGCAFVTGVTASDDFPTQNPFQAAKSGIRDAFVTRLSAAGNSLLYSTYLGGAGYDQGNGITVDKAGFAWITGYTDSADFPTQNPIQAARAGNEDAFITMLSAAGNSLLYSTYLGGTGTDEGRSVAVDSSYCYITGHTNSTDFPTKNPFQPANAGNRDAFVAKIGLTVPNVTTKSATAVTSNSAALNMAYALGDFNQADVRFAWKKAAEKSWTYTGWASRSANGTYSRPVTGLAPDTAYTFKAQLKYGSAIIDGSTLRFTTGASLVGSSIPHGSSMPTPASVNAPPVINPSLVIQSATVSQTGKYGEAVVTAIVSNTSTVNGTSNIRLYVSGEMEAEQAVAVDAGKQAPVSFTVLRDSPGTYQVYVNSTPAGIFVVEGYPNPDAILYVSLSFIFISLLLGVIYVFRRNPNC